MVPRMRRATSSTVSLPAGASHSGKFAEQHAGNAAQLARLLQVHQRAVHLPGFHAAIFEQQNRAVRVEFPGSAERGFDQREAAAEKNAVGRARHHGFGAGERDRPTCAWFPLARA